MRPIPFIWSLSQLRPPTRAKPYGAFTATMTILISHHFFCSYWHNNVLLLLNKADFIWLERNLTQLNKLYHLERVIFDLTLEYNFYLKRIQLNMWFCSKTSWESEISALSPKHCTGFSRSGRSGRGRCVCGFTMGQTAPNICFFLFSFFFILYFYFFVSNFLLICIYFLPLVEMRLFIWNYTESNSITKINIHIHAYTQMDT